MTLDLVQRDLVLVAEVLHGRLGPFQPELVVEWLRASRIRVALDLEVDVLTVGLDAGDQFIDARLGRIRQIPLPAGEVGLVGRHCHGVDELPRRRVDSDGLGVSHARLGVGISRGLARRVG